MNVCIVNKEDFKSLPGIKKLGADHMFSVVHDDDCPRGYAIFVFSDCVIVRDMNTKEERLYV